MVCIDDFVAGRARRERPVHADDYAGFNAIFEGNSAEAAVRRMSGANSSTCMPQTGALHSSRISCGSSLIT
jgi:hypothetical protein